MVEHFPQILASEEKATTTTTTIPSGFQSVVPCFTVWTGGRYNELSLVPLQYWNEQLVSLYVI